jgi:hypothetical protein
MTVEVRNREALLRDALSAATLPSSSHSGCAASARYSALCAFRGEVLNVAAIDHTETLTILESFNGPVSLKKLQAHLNWDPAASPIPRQGWKPATSALLGSDPVITASIGGAAGLFGAEESFKVIYCRMASKELLLVPQRSVVAELLKKYENALFVFSDADQKRFHFLNVKDEPQGQKRQLFRRIAVGAGERLRTAAQRLDMLDGEDLKNASLSEIRQRFDEAFDVGPVTKKFFLEYKRIFGEVKDSLKGFAAGKEGDEARNLFTQRLFNRLMFIAFIQKKGWLKYGGDTDYLAALWEAHRKDKFENKGTFYAGRLKPLFFLGLNTGPAEVNLIGINRGGGLAELIGDVPYLNGGLFEKDADDDNSKIVVPDAGLGEVINGLFEEFNFTITESTPLDIEVAVDPEMLGKIFEALVTGRHESGSYYTPKPIVSFMCREALKGYLETQATAESKEAVARFVDKHEPDDIGDAETVLNALRRVTVCDPACGSGAYLLGMLHELLDLRQCLFQTNNVDKVSVYNRKLEIIQTNIYGVDIAEFAVNIARLRLWLSLAVDFDGNKPEPLPNLDYKIEVGDSVCSPSPGALQIGMQQPLVDELLTLKAKYLRSHHGDKRALREQIEAIRLDIRIFSHRGGEAFDWVIDFAEVFAFGGFDIVIANPPYVRMELFKAIKPVLKRRFPVVHADRADLYCYFYARSVELLHDDGMMSLISPDKWMRSGYGKNLRGYLSGMTRIQSILDFGDLPVFEEAQAYPMILCARRTPLMSESPFQFCAVKDLEFPYPDVKRVLDESGSTLSSKLLQADTWDFQELISGNKFQSLREYIGGLALYGVKTGLNAAFVVSVEEAQALIDSDELCAEFLKPLLTGKDISQWESSKAVKRLIYTYHGSKPPKAILKHLNNFREALEQRATTQEWFELQQPQERYTRQFSGPKIVYPIISKSPRFSLDKTGSFINDKAYAIPLHDLYLLGILNSQKFWSMIASSCSPLRGGFYELRITQLGRLPIPIPDTAARQVIEDLVKDRLKARDLTEVTDLEARLNAEVQSLYEQK